MFTGIVEELGSFKGRDGNQFKFAAETVLVDMALGHSIAVNGACLTAVDRGKDWWVADVSDETIERTNLGLLTPGSLVNFERPVRTQDRLGGHVVLGHVDGQGVIVAPAPDLRVRIDKDLMRYCVEKGSITIDGISLTIFDLDADSFSVAVIPHTAAVTTLGSKGPGEKVNIEVDVLAKHVERLLAAYLPKAIE